MAVNNGLRRDTEKQDDKEKAVQRTKVSKAKISTSVLGFDCVSDRGSGTNTQGELEVDKQIENFLKGEGKCGPRAEIRAFFTVWTFITRLPGPAWIDHHPGYLMRGMAYFPLAGCIVGGILAVVFDFLAVLLPVEVAATFCTAVSLYITGCFHEDGLADASDGIGGGWSTSQILKIMSDTRLGTYGCISLIVYLLLKVQLLAALGGSEWVLFNCKGAGPALLLSACLSRWTAPFLIHTNDYVDEGGPKYKYYGFMLRAKLLVTTHRLVFATVSMLFVLAIVRFDILVLLALFFISLVAGRYAKRLLGGVMGDYLGGTICITEIVVLACILVKNQGWLGTLEDWDSSTVFTVSRFIICSIALAVWCSSVGHPDVFVKEQVRPSADKEHDIKKEDMPFETLDAHSSFCEKYNKLKLTIDSLCKPQGSLGTLEDWAARLGALQSTSSPKILRPMLTIFAGDHGVAKSIENGGEACSAYPQEVTRSILKALETGRAGACVLAKANSIPIHIIDVGVAGVSCKGLPSHFKLPDGTRNIMKEPAMTREEVDKLLRVGRDMVVQASSSGHDALILGEIGIGNTTVSSLLLCAITGKSPEACCDRGATLSSEIDQGVVKNKIRIIKQANLEDLEDLENLEELLSRFGGAEIVALVGSILQCSEMNIPVLVDGFIVTVAALCAANIDKNITRVLFLATASAEKGHQVAIDALRAMALSAGIPPPPLPALSMGLRLGEGTGGILAASILKSACSLYFMAKLSDIISK